MSRSWKTILLVGAERPLFFVCVAHISTPGTTQQRGYTRVTVRLYLLVLQATTFRNLLLLD